MYLKKISYCFIFLISSNLFCAARIVNQWESNGSLIEAIAKRDFLQVKNALQHCDPNAEFQGSSPLFHALSGNFHDDEIVKLLVDSGAKFNNNSLEIEFFLPKAIEINEFSLIKYLIDNKVINIDSGRVGLLAHAFKHNREIAKLFIDNGFIPDINRFTDLGLYTSDDLFKFVINEGSPLNNISHTGDTPLLLSVNHQNKNRVELLLKSGADIDIENVHGFTPLLCSIMNNNYEIIVILLNHGANLGNNYSKFIDFVKTRESIDEKIINLLENEPQKREAAIKDKKIELLNLNPVPCLDTHIAGLIADYAISYKDTLKPQSPVVHGPEKRKAKFAQRQEAIQRLLINGNFPKVLAKLINDYSGEIDYWDIPKEDRIKYDIEDSIKESRNQLVSSAHKYKALLTDIINRSKSTPKDNK